MSTVLTSQIIQNAKAAVDTYSSNASALYTELDGVITALRTSNFVGDASDGYLAFFNNQVTPALTENLYQGDQALTANIKALLDTVEQQLLRAVDPQLGENHRNPGGQ